MTILKVIKKQMSKTVMKAMRRAPMPKRRNHAFSKQKLILSWLALIVVLIVPTQALAVEMVANGDFNGNYTGWTLTDANGANVTYDGADGAAANGSMQSAPTDGRKNGGIFTLEQPVTISSSSTINSVGIQGKNTASPVEAFASDITITLHYVDNITTVDIFTGTVPNNSTWAAVTNGTTLPTLAQDVNKITVTVNHQTPNDNAGSSTLWIDDISIDYTAGAGCTTAAPTLDFGAGTTIAASDSTQYTLTITNNDSGAGCSDRSFNVSITNETMTPNDGSFNASSLSGTCNPTVAAGATNTQCLLDVTSGAGAVDGTQLAVTVTDSVSTETGSVTTTIALGGGGYGCDDCHGNRSTLKEFPTDAASRTTAGATEGNHAVHVDTQGYACTICHVDNTGNSTHLNTNVEMNPGGTAISGGYYDKTGTGLPYAAADATWAQNSVANVATQTCLTTNCHGTASDIWGTSPGGDTCTKCHGVKGQASPSDAQIAPGGTGVDTAGHSVATDAQVGAHQAHLTSASNYSSDIACAECHVKPTASNDAGHIDDALPADMTWGTLATTGSLSPSFAGSGGACTNTYCHGAAMPSGSSDGADPTPVWTDTAYLDGSTFNTDCARCHGFPPKGYSGSHESMTDGDGRDCETCHSHLNDGVDANESGWAVAVFNDPSLHINGTVDASGGHGVGADCKGCHAGAKGSKRAIQGEFNSQYSHGPDGTTSWNSLASSDCEACHDESANNDNVLQLKVVGGSNINLTWKASYSQAELASLNDHCLSCHDGAGTSIGGVAPTTRDNIAAMWTNATASSHTYSGWAQVPQKTKARSAHGFPGTNALKDESARTGYSGAVACLECHPAHGSGSKSPDSTKGNLGVVGNMMVSDYAEPTSCWTCHDNAGVLDYMGDSTTAGQHWTGTKKSAFAYKQRSFMSTHDVNGAGNQACSICHNPHGAVAGPQYYTPMLRDTWLTSPYPEDRAGGLSAGQGGNGSASTVTAFGKGSGLGPRADSAAAYVAPLNWGHGYGANAGANGWDGYYIDDNTFGITSANYPSLGTISRISEAATSFAGLCARCHTSSTNAGGAVTDMETFLTQTAQGATGWGTPVHEAVKGWDTVSGGDPVNSGNNPYMHNLHSTSTEAVRFRFDDAYYGPRQGYRWGADPFAGEQAAYHQFPCSKCHTPHANSLPRLMVTNCIDVGVSNGTRKAHGTEGSYTLPTAAIGWQTADPGNAGNVAMHCHNNATTNTAAGSGWNEATGW